MAGEGGDKSSIGEVSFDVVANTTPLDATLQQAEAKAEASGQRMAQSLVVPIGDKRALGGGGGGIGPMPIGDKSGFAVVAQEQENVKKGLVDIGVESQKSFRGALGLITRTTGAMALMAGAAMGVVRVIKDIYDGLQGGEVAAMKFKSALDGEGVAKQFTEQKNRINEINKLLTERQTASMWEKFTTMGRAAALREEQKLLIGSQKVMDDQVKALEKQAKLRADIATYEKNVLESRKEIAEQTMDDLDRRLAAGEAGREDKANRDAQKQADIDAADEVHQEKMKFAEEVYEQNRRLIDPVGSAAAEHNKVLRQLDQAERSADTERERKMVEMARTAAIEGFIKGITENENKIRDALLNALNSAIQASNSTQFGAQHQTTLLRDINLKLAAIQAVIPRN